MIYKITDDSGFMGIIDNHKYRSFVNENWNFEQLITHFKQEMSNHSLLLWATGIENTWKVKFQNRFSDENGYREMIGNIIVTNNELYLINYESLTMAAQFENLVLPEKHMQGLKIPLKNGIYKFRIVQLNDPKLFSSNEDVDILVECELTTDIEYKWHKIPWYENGCN